MATGKKYYWIKLKTDFMTSDKVDYLMSQPNGAEYVVLYQMLCMKCINTDGLLARQIGEVIIPFDAEKIARDCKYFSVDTVKVAFNLFIQLGMIYQEDSGYLRIANFENMVGSETDWAAQKRQQVKNKENIAIESGNTVESGVENLHTDIRDKRLDIDNINLNSDSDAGIKKQKHKFGIYNNVLLTEDERQKLTTDLGDYKSDAVINHFSELKEMKGYKYKSDYLAIKKWGIQSYEETIKKKNTNTGNIKKDLNDTTGWL